MHAANETDHEELTVQPTANAVDAHEGLRALYVALLMRQDRFDEFKRLLALYPEAMPNESFESTEAALIRALLNQRIHHWIKGNFAGLDRVAVLKWRAALVEERPNIALSNR